jgi:hypothetical protein
MIDLEGTLSDHTDRLALLQDDQKKYLNRDPAAWKIYYKGLIEDKPRPHIMDLTRDYIADGDRPLVYSTRFINKYNHEEQWLRMHDLWKYVDLVQRLKTETKIKGPDLVLQWVRRYDPDVVIDDRDDVRELIRSAVRTVVVYGPNAFLQIEGESNEHPLRE